MYNDLLLAMLARAAERLVGKFNTQDFANMAWAFAMADSLDALLFAALASVEKRLVHESDSQVLTNMAWSFATADWLDVLADMT